MSALDAAALEKLVRVAGMLGSDHDGERATAARHASAILSAARLTWRDVLSAPEPCPVCARRQAARESWRAAVALALDHEHLLSAWEAEFCRSLLGRGGLSARQREVLARISAKVESGL